MKRVARSEEFLFNLNIELILSICSAILKDDFVAFTNFFRVWAVYKSDEEIFNLLHHLDWSSMHVHSLSWNRITMESFNLFLTKCSEMRVLHALTFNACNNLFINREVVDNMILLEILSHHDDLSFFSLHIFRPYFNVLAFDESAKAMFGRFQNQISFREQLEKFTESLKGRLAIAAGGWEQHNVLSPSFPLCRFYKRTSDEHFFPYGWPTNIEAVKKSRRYYCLLHMIFQLIFQ